MSDLSSSSKSSRTYPGWRVVAVCFVMALFGWGFGFYGHAIYLAELQRLHGWPASLIAGASTVYYLCGALLVAFVADAIARFGPKLFVLGGIACMALAAGLLTVVTEIWQLYGAYLLMSFGWAAMGLGSITNIVGLWFRDRAGWRSVSRSMAQAVAASYWRRCWCTSLGTSDLRARCGSRSPRCC